MLAFRDFLSHLFSYTYFPLLSIRGLFYFKSEKKVIEVHDKNCEIEGNSLSPLALSPVTTVNSYISFQEIAFYIGCMAGLACVVGG